MFHVKRPLRPPAATISPIPATGRCGRGSSPRTTSQPPRPSNHAKSGPGNDLRHPPPQGAATTTCGSPENLRPPAGVGAAPRRGQPPNHRDQPITPYPAHRRRPTTPPAARSGDYNLRFARNLRPPAGVGAAHRRGQTSIRRDQPITPYPAHRRRPTTLPAARSGDYNLRFARKPPATARCRRGSSPRTTSQPPRPTDHASAPPQHPHDPPALNRIRNKLRICTNVNPTKIEPITHAAAVA